MKNTFKKFIVKILKIESQLVLWKYKPKIVAITGSVGKTSTKDAVYAVLSKVAYVRKSDKSYNSQIGLPLTILGIPNGWNDPYLWLKNILRGLWLFIWSHKYPEWLVLEVGVGKPGDMRETASWLRTDAVIITAIGDTPVHVEFFDSKEHLVEEKSGLIKTLKKDGFLILNKDDETVFNMKIKTKSAFYTYGFSADANVIASGESVFYAKENDEEEPQGLIFRVDEGGKSFPVIISNAFGKNHVYASLAALCLAFALKVNTLDAIEALKNYEMPPGRMRLLKGIKNSLIIDDTYNSSPFACQAALDTLGGMKSFGRKVAVLGDMLELGKYTEEAHKSMGMLAKEKADFLFVIGPRARGMMEGALAQGMSKDNVKDFADSVSAGIFLKDFVEKGDTILVKGSQGMRMERVVEAILKEGEDKEKLLVRQDKEWKDKN